MAEVKEELIKLSGEWCEVEEEEEDNIDDTEDTVEEEVEEKEEDQEEEDLFNPFADLKEDEVEEKPEEKKEEEEEKPEVKTDDNFSKQYQADKQAGKEVKAFIEKNPMYKEFQDDITEIASKAILSGHSKPVEFAVRNVKPVGFWVEYGMKIGSRDAGNALKTVTLGSSKSKTDGGEPDFSTTGMKSSDFESYVNKVKNL